MKRQEFINTQVAEEIAKLIHENLDKKDFLQRLDDYHDYDIAQALPSLTMEERLKLYRKLGTDWVSEIFPYLEEPEQLLMELKPEYAAMIIEEMDSDEAAEILKEVDTERRKELGGYLSEETKSEIRLLDSYDEDELGSYMTTNYVEIEKDYTVKEAMKALIRQTKDNDNIATLYVVDANGFFEGAIDLKDLILARAETPLQSIISTSYPFVHDNDNVAESIQWLKEYEEDSIPVLDKKGYLIGAITVQDVVEFMDENTKEVYNKLAGIQESDNEDMKETLAQSMKKRMPWLIVLLVLGMGVSTVVGMFEDVVAQVALLVSFQSLILDMAGNVGTQSLAVTIRVLMDEKMNLKMRLKLISKEVRVGFANGILLGIIAVVAIGAYIVFFKDRGVTYALAVSGCVGVALVVAMAISSFVGTAIPLFFNKIHVDPAVASGPLITTVNDLVAVITYYGLAWLMLIQIFQIAS